MGDGGWGLLGVWVGVRVGPWGEGAVAVWRGGLISIAEAARKSKWQSKGAAMHGLQLRCLRRYGA